MLYIGDFVIRKHFCIDGKHIYRDGIDILEITFKKSQIGKYGESIYKEHKIKGRCIRCHGIIDIYDDDYKIIDRDVGNAY